MPQAGGRGVGLTGRRAECATLDRLTAAVRAGDGRGLVVRGEAGVGKTALLDDLAARATGFRVVRVAGVQSEMELAFAGLHQMCAPMTDRLDDLAAPRRDALRIAFGMSSGPPPDRFLIGLAVLSLLSGLEEQRPLLCLVDDEQWLDRASAQALAFVARRLAAESVGLVFAVREPDPDLAGLPELVLGGLREADARALLDSVLTGPLDARVRDQIVAETRGNPLALLELPNGRTAELAGGFRPPGALPTAGVEESFRRRCDALPADTRRMLLLVAADPTGDPALLWRAAGRLGIGADAMTPAVEADLAGAGTRVWFRHPLIRTVIYRSAAPEERRAAHRALAQATDRAHDPDRRAWHLAQATAGPDAAVAAELERSAGRARARGGLAAAAAFTERAALLTPDPALRAGRGLTAATTMFASGAFRPAQHLLAVAEAGPLTELEQARADVLRARLAFATSRGGDAPLLLAKAAARLEPIDAGLARATYLDALSAAMFAGRLAGPGGGVLDVARAAGAAPRPLHTPRATDLLLDGLAANFNDGYPAGVPILRRALSAFGTGMPADEELRRLWMINEAALHLWDDERWDALSRRYVELAHATGALSELPLALSTRAYMLLFSGDLTAASSLIDEGTAVTEATGARLAPYSAMCLAAMRGRHAETTALVEATTAEVAARGEGIGIAVAHWAQAVLYNGLGDYPAAMTAARQALYHQEYPEMRYPGVANWAAAELVEAAVRGGSAETASAAYDWIAEMAAASGTDWALGVRARAGALLAGGEAAERLYRESIARLARTRVRSELGRVHLLYGEWLRRERRRGDAREELRAAHGLLEPMGMTAFAERAARELRATGATARKRTVPVTTELTAQESRIAGLARDGLSNPEIGTRLFISERTVQYHLRKVFTKLGITSRAQLDRVLPGGAAAARAR